MGSWGWAQLGATGWILRAQIPSCEQASPAYPHCSASLRVLSSLPGKTKQNEGSGLQEREGEPPSLERGREPRLPSADTNKADVVSMPLCHFLAAEHLTCLLWVLPLHLSVCLSQPVFTNALSARHLPLVSPSLGL